MGKAKTARKGGAGATSPYSRPASKGAAAQKNNVFKFNTNVGQVRDRGPGQQFSPKLTYGRSIS